MALTVSKMLVKRDYLLMDAFKCIPAASVSGQHTLERCTPQLLAIGYLMAHPLFVQVVISCNTWLFGYKIPKSAV